MVLRRPTHLVQRQIRGRAFSEEITLRKETGHRDEYGEFVRQTTSTDTLCATAPATGNEGRVRELMEGGVDLEATRLFWIVEDVDPVVEGGGSGDVIVYAGERYKVRSTGRWGGFSELIGVREDSE